MVSFEDPMVIAEKDILAIDDKGIQHTKGTIDFAECAKNYALENQMESTTCVAARDITGRNPCFDFYTSGRITELFFIPKSRFFEFFSRQNTAWRFHAFNKRILSSGWTTYDMS